MTRASLFRLALFLTFALAASPALVAAAPQPRRPDLLFVLADDLDAAAVGYLPQLRALAAEGTTFARAYVTVPLCAPARATVLTGRYPQNTGVRRNLPPFGGLETFFAAGMEDRSVALWLRGAGYRTGLIGKYVNQHTDGGPPPMRVPPGWDRWVTAAEYRYTHQYYGFELNEDGRRVAYPRAGGSYLFDVLDAKARGFVRDAAGRPQPMALFYWPPIPHEPVVPAPRFATYYPRAVVPRRPSLPELDTSDKPLFLRYPVPAPEALAAVDAAHRERLRVLRSLDETLGSLRALLAAAGRLETTNIVVASDNGWHHAYHNLPPWKGTAYEEDVRVPLLVRGPGVAAGRTIRRLVGNADLAPTFAEWAGAPVPDAVDGRSLVPLLAAADPDALPWRRRLPLARLPEATAAPAAAWPRHGAPAGPPAPGYGCMAAVPPWPPTPSDLRRGPVPMPEYRGLRDERWTFVQYASGDLELYDDDADPSQVRNAVCSASRALVDEMSAAAATLAACAGQACRDAEDR